MVAHATLRCDYHGTVPACRTCGRCLPCCREWRWSTATGDEDWRKAPHPQRREA